MNKTVRSVAISGLAVENVRAYHRTYVRGHADKDCREDVTFTMSEIRHSLRATLNEHRRISLSRNTALCPLS